MDSGYYAACTALKTQTNALELAANNIANVNTTGYRGQIPSFQSFLLENHASSMGAVNGWSRLINQFAILNDFRITADVGCHDR